MMPILFGWMPGQWELLIIAGVALLLFGPALLPRMFRSLGESVTAFRSSVKEAQSAFEEAGVTPEKESKKV